MEANVSANLKAIATFILMVYMIGRIATVTGRGPITALTTNFCQLGETRKERKRMKMPTRRRPSVLRKIHETVGDQNQVIITGSTILTWTQRTSSDHMRMIVLWQRKMRKMKTQSQL